MFSLHVFFSPILCSFLLETTSNLDTILSLFLSLFSFLNKQSYLPIFGCAGSSMLCWLFSSYSAGASHRWFLSCGAQAPGRAASAGVAGGISSCAPGAQSEAPQLWPRAYCPVVARGIFPDQGSDQYLLHSLVDSSPLSHQGSPASLHFHLFVFLVLFLSIIIDHHYYYVHDA